MVSILIVVYNCNISSSRTINGFLNSKVSLKNVNLVVWNNGPTYFDNVDFSRLNAKGINTFFHQTIDNKPLSYIYNEFISRYNSDYYIILDHDSFITDSYIESILDFHNSKAEVGVPSISVEGRYISPVVNGKYTVGPYTNKQRLIAIGSGITFSHNVALTLKNKYGNVFDTAFALYGIDTSFFLRLYQLGLIEKIKLIPGFSHSLSRLEKESAEKTEFRNIERSYDIGITLKRYFSVFQLWYTIKILIKIFIGKSKLKPWLIIKSFFCGIHPRCRLVD